MQQHHDSLAGLRILIVEDELLIAMEIEAILDNLGCIIVGPAGTVAAAAAAIDNGGRIDGVLLDLNIGGETALPVAEELLARDVPFLLVTGYASRPSDPPLLRDAPRLNKPFNQDKLAQAMANEFVQRAG